MAGGMWGYNTKQFLSATSSSSHLSSAPHGSSMGCSEIYLEPCNTLPPSSGFGVSSAVSHSFRSLRGVYSLFLNVFSQRHHQFCWWDQLCLLLYQTLPHTPSTISLRKNPIVGNPSNAKHFSSGSWFSSLKCKLCLFFLKVSGTGVDCISGKCSTDVIWIIWIISKPPKFLSASPIHRKQFQCDLSHNIDPLLGKPSFMVKHFIWITRYIPQ